MRLVVGSLDAPRFGDLTFRLFEECTPSDIPDVELDETGRLVLYTALRRLDPPSAPAAHFAESLSDLSELTRGDLYNQLQYVSFVDEIPSGCASIRVPTLDPLSTAIGLALAVGLPDRSVEMYSTLWDRLVDVVSYVAHLRDADLTIFSPYLRYPHLFDSIVVSGIRLDYAGDKLGKVFSLREHVRGLEEVRLVEPRDFGLSKPVDSPRLNDVDLAILRLLEEVGFMSVQALLDMVETDRERAVGSLARLEALGLVKSSLGPDKVVRAAITDVGRAVASRLRQ